MANKEKYKLTAKLIRAAINNGMTQKDIANKCRVNQPQVSKWLNGNDKGTVQQLTPIIELFEHEIVRKTSELYYNFDEDSKKHNYYKVIGDIIFKHDIYKYDQNIIRGNKKILEKIVIHEKARNVFTLVHSKPGVISQDFINTKNITSSVYNSSENIFWSQVHEFKEPNSLINYIDNIATRKSTFYYAENGQLKNKDYDINLQRKLMNASLDEFITIRSKELKDDYTKELQSIESRNIHRMKTKEGKLNYIEERTLRLDKAIDELEKNAEDMYNNAKSKAIKQVEILEKLPEVIYPQRMDLYVQLPFLIRKSLVKRGYNIEGINNI